MNQQLQNNIPFIKEPLTLEDIKKQMLNNKNIQANVLVSIDELLNYNRESFEELLDDKVLSVPHIINGLDYFPLGIHEKQIILYVTGYIEDFQDKLNEWEQQLKVKGE